MELSAGLPERAEGERRQTGGRPGEPGPVADPELAEKAKRRRFTAQYKLRIVREADRCERSGEVGALLRREGLYSSLLTEWRRARDSGALDALEPKKRGPRPVSSEQTELVALRGQLTRSRADLTTARRVIEVQGNVSALLEELLAKSAPEQGEQRGTR